MIKSLKLLSVEVIINENIEYNNGPDNCNIDINSNELIELYKKCGNDWNNVLIFACGKGYLDIVKLMINDVDCILLSTENINLSSEAFQCAVKAGHLEIIQFFIENIFNKSDIIACGKWAIVAAAKHNHLHIIKYFVENSCIFNNFIENNDFIGPYNRYGPFGVFGPREPIQIYNKAFYHASDQGHLDVIKYLINFVDIQSNENWAVIGAAAQGHLDIVKYLCDAGANVRDRNELALSLASEHGHLEVVKYLIEDAHDKSNIHAYDDYALRYASYRGHLKVVKYLCEMGANIHAYEDWSIIYAALNGRLKVVKYLCEMGANIHINNNYALRWAIKYGHLNVVKYICEKNINIENIYLKIAINNNHTEIVEYLNSLRV